MNNITLKKQQQQQQQQHGVLNNITLKKQQQQQHGVLNNITLKKQEEDGVLDNITWGSTKCHHMGPNIVMG